MINQFFHAEIHPYKMKNIIQDSTLYKQFLNAKNLLEGFRNKVLPAHQVFDLDKMGVYVAIGDLFGRPNEHATLLRNMKFYYNPISSNKTPDGW